MSFRAVRVTKNGDAQAASVETLDDNALPDGEVTVDVDYSNVNYKDGLIITGRLDLIETFPVTAGIDLAGTVEASTDPAFQPGQSITVNGWGLGTHHDGGFAQRARVHADWVTPLPDGISSYSASAIGTAGYTAALAVQALLDHAVTPAAGPVLVTGAAGGAGSVAVALLSNLGFGVAASTGRPQESDYLRSLGADSIIDRNTLSGPADNPFGVERWAGAIDAVGSHTLANVISHIRYGGTVAAFGLAQGVDLPGSVLPFIARNVTLAGIDSVYAPSGARERAWKLLSEHLDPAVLGKMTETIPLDAAIPASHAVLEGKVRGRLVVDVNT